MKLQDIETAFTNGCDTIVSGITAYGITPKSNSPADIVTAIGGVYDNGVSYGKANPTYKTGTFNDWNAVTIDCGFRPKIIIVTNMHGCAAYDKKTGKNVAVVKGNVVHSNPFTITSSGFTFASVTNMNATECSYVAYG